MYVKNLVKLKIKIVKTKCVAFVGKTNVNVKVC